MPPEPPATPSNGGVVLSLREGGAGGPPALPRGPALDEEGCRALDRRLGVPAEVLDAVYAPARRTGYEVLGLLAALLAATLALAGLFPWNRFLRPLPERRGERFAPAFLGDTEVRRRGVPEALDPVDRARYSLTKLLQDGNLPKARAICEYELDRTPPEAWRRWLPVWNHYFDILFRMRELGTLRDATHRLLEQVPGHTPALWYQAQALVYRFPRRDSYPTDTPWQGWAERALELTDRALEVLDARAAAHGEAIPDETRRRLDEEQRLVLLLAARLHMYLWWTAGRPDHGPVVDQTRDAALALLDRLGPRDAEALALRRRILGDILDDWSWLEGKEPYRGREVEKDVVRAEFDQADAALRRLRAAETEGGETP